MSGRLHSGQWRSYPTDCRLSKRLVANVDKYVIALDILFFLMPALGNIEWSLHHLS